ncbi:hypothetical protein BGZ49_000879 [Haplosporangium sp. Z 27]|nr:hypothetical protein BGZ49_000879 [Haplosporangium sp. Z 27]
MAASATDSEKIWFKFNIPGRAWEKIPLERTIKDIDSLKQAIKNHDDARKEGEQKVLDGIDLNNVTLNASLQDDYSESKSVSEPLKLETVLTQFGVPIGDDICKQFAENVWIFVNLPQQDSERQKRGHDNFEVDEGDETSSKRPKVEEDNLIKAIRAAGFSKKAIVDGDGDLSRLKSKELVSVLENIGKRTARTNIYQAISRTASSLKHSSFEKADYVISSLPETKLPVIETQDLYVRQEFKDLYDIITKQFCNAENNAQNRIVVTGTAGIGKSSFLIYFAIRLLATSNEEDPPIVIIQRKEDSECYAFGGLSSVRNGDIKDFTPFLDLPNTWFLVDSSPKPELTEARTIFSVSPKTLFSESNLYQEIVKRVVWTYYMAPWELDELRQCRRMVHAFNIVSEKFMVELYNLIDGVPRYVLEKPGNQLHFDKKDLDTARKEACSRVEAALANLNNPLRLLQYFEQAKDSLQYSSRLLHRRPIGNHRHFELEWASNYILEKVYEAADDNTFNMILDRLVNGKVGEDQGAMLKICIRRILRRGDCNFVARSLGVKKKQDITIAINANPTVKFFDAFDVYKESMKGALWIPNSKTFACVDMLIAPNYLLQITTNVNHGIKSESFKALLKTLEEKEWIRSEKDVVLIFVVPKAKAEEYKKQTFRIGANRVDPKPTKQLSNIKQYVLGVDLKAELRRGRLRGRTKAR